MFFILLKIYSVVLWFCFILLMMFFKIDKEVVRLLIFILNVVCVLSDLYFRFMCKYNIFFDWIFDYRVVLLIVNVVGIIVYLFV